MRTPTPEWLPTPGHLVFLRADEGKVHWNAYLAPSAAKGNHDAFYVVVVRADPKGNFEVLGTGTPVSRGRVARVLANAAFPVEVANWDHHPLTNEADDPYVLHLDRRWSWPHILFNTKYLWELSRQNRRAA